jgi:hypothetical protein
MIAHEIVDRAFNSEAVATTSYGMCMQLGGSDNVPTSTESGRFLDPLYLLQGVMMDVS